MTYPFESMISPEPFPSMGTTPYEKSRVTLTLSMLTTLSLSLSTAPVIWLSREVRIDMFRAPSSSFQRALSLRRDRLPFLLIRLLHLFGRLLEPTCSSSPHLPRVGLPCFLVKLPGLFS